MRWIQCLALHCGHTLPCSPSASLPLLPCFLIPRSTVLLKLKIEPHLPLPPCSLPPFLLQEISKREEASGQLSCIQLPVDSSGVRTAHPTPPCSSLSWCLVTHRAAVLILVAVIWGSTWVFWKWFFFGFSFLFFVTLIVESALILSPFLL